MWEGEGVVKSARKLIGATNPLESEPGTIRGDFAVKVGRVCEQALRAAFPRVAVLCCAQQKMHLKKGRREAGWLVGQAPFPLLDFEPGTICDDFQAQVGGLCSQPSALAVPACVLSCRMAFQPPTRRSPCPSPSAGGPQRCARQRQRRERRARDGCAGRQGGGCSCVGAVTMPQREAGGCAVGPAVGGVSLPPSRHLSWYCCQRTACLP